jgi:hypothetical protein
MPRLSHLDYTCECGSHSQICLRVYRDVWIAERGSLSLLCRSFLLKKKNIYIYIYVYVVSRAQVWLLFEIYLFHCNPDYYFFLFCIDVNKYIYSFVIIIGASRHPTDSHRSRYGLTKIYTCYIQYLFYENFLCACVFEIKILVVIVRVQLKKFVVHVYDAFTVFARRDVTIVLVT